MTRLPFELQAGLWHFTIAAPGESIGTRLANAIICANSRRIHPVRRIETLSPSCPDRSHLATEQELSDFLKSVEKRAFKRSIYHVRNEESALDIVQDSMMKLAEHYGDKPTSELPMLFQRILVNCTLDWFRRNKTRNALFSNMSEFESPGEDGDFNLLETYAGLEDSQQSESAEDVTRRAHFA